MNMQDRVHNGTRNQRIISANMKKTLFIGIGGSGKEVLMRLRRKFYSASENKYGHDFIRYLWIDTDPSGSPICDEKWEVIGENIRFGIRDTIDEVFDASIEKDVLKDLYSKVNIYEHISYWFPVNSIKHLGTEALLNGAKGIRPLGRLAFAWHSSEILQILQGNISSLDRQFNIKGIVVDNSIDVYVVGSLAGGTGSGMFLELAKMLKANWPTNSVYGVFFLSDMFADKGDNEYRDANCYAALQELDFYQTASNSFDPLISKERHMFEFIESNGIKRSFNLPLYSNVFLITNEYYKSPKEDLFSDPFEMVAEIFFYDFDKSAFGANKRSRTVNTQICGSQASVKYAMFDNVTKNKIGVESSYHSDYSSFALSGIFLNISKMKSWASYKYITDLISNLLKSNPSNNQIYENPDSSFKISKLNFDDILRKITHGTRANSVLEEYIGGINSRKQKKQIEIFARISFDHTSISQVQEVCQEQFQIIDGFIDDEVEKMNIEFKVFNNIAGEALKKLNTNFKNGLADMYKEIEKLMYDILADYENGGITVAIEMLERVKVVVSQMDINIVSYNRETKRLEADLKDEKPEYPAIQIDSKINKLLQRIQDSNEIPSIFPGYKGKAKKYYDRKLSHGINHMNREIIQQIQGYFDTYLANTKAQLVILYRSKIESIIKELKRGILEMVDSVKIPDLDHIMGFNKQINEYRKMLSSLESYFKKYEESLKTEISTKLNRKMILDDNLDTDTLYNDFLRRLNGDDWFVSEVANYFLKAVNNVHAPNSDINESMQQFVKIMVFYNQINVRDINEDIKAILKQACRNEFNNFMQDKSVLDVLSEEIRVNEGLYRHSISNMLSNFNFRLALSQSYTIIKEKIEKTSMVRIVGSPTPDKNIEDFLKSLGNVKNIMYHGSNEGILFYSETFGFPLFMLKNIENLKLRFTTNIAAGDNKYFRYTDIVTDYLRPLVIPQSTEAMKEILYSWEVFYEAVVLRVIKYEKRNWCASIIDGEFGLEKNIVFGKTLEASVSKLNSNNKLLVKIRDITADVFAAKYNSEDKICQILYALYANYEEVSKFVDNQFQVDKPKIPQEYVLEKLLNKYISKRAQILSIANNDKFKNELRDEYEKVITISSGYMDSIHQNGLKIYPK